ncbi:uncharacterized protein YjbJ (UPF0337 family) [Granulicella aggregans]|uniref:Uncharacterized protein YjbJ (UPF0337 family) n=1 Tax=Granulicella aggregans TaxID=474949 RepID=A0A7W7ZHZ2_9BACT|nr:CsbD family protein [Granulicella aggregans]MBB5060218.1 uncharacterized protein YjbJ (UPF0337 family) [Granulicella aggregans]
MKVLPWILVGVSIGLLAFFALNEPNPQYATGSEDVEDAAGKASQWGSKQRASGLGHNVVGKVKEGFGGATGNNDLAVEGATERVVGVVKDVAGQTAHAVGKTLHELNR